MTMAPNLQLLTQAPQPVQSSVKRALPSTISMAPYGQAARHSLQPVHFSVSM